MSFSWEEHGYFGLIIDLFSGHWIYWWQSVSVRKVLPGSTCCCLTGISSLVCMELDTTLNAVQAFQFHLNVQHLESLRTPSALKSLIFLPLMVMNLLATTLICYKVWCGMPLQVHNCLVLIIYRQAVSTRHSHVRYPQYRRIFFVYRLFCAVIPCPCTVDRYWSIIWDIICIFQTFLACSSLSTLTFEIISYSICCSHLVYFKQHEKTISLLCYGTKSWMQ